MENLDNKINLARTFVLSVPPYHPERPERLLYLIELLYARFVRSEDGKADVQDAITCILEVIDIEGTRGQDVTSSQLCLGRLLSSLYSKTLDLDHISEAIDATRVGVTNTPPNASHRAQGQLQLAGLLGDRFRHSQDPADVEDAIRIARQALESSSSDDERRKALRTLGMGLFSRFTVLGGKREDLDDALKFARQAVEISPDRRSDRAGALNALANRLGARWALVGIRKDLEEAVAMAREAVFMTPDDDHGCRAMHLTNLASQLSDLYSITQKEKDLKEAIKFGRDAAQVESNYSLVEKAGNLVNLATLLGVQYRADNDVAHLTEAIEFARESTHIMPENHPKRPLCLDSLGNLLGDRFEHANEDAKRISEDALPDLDDAVKANREAANSIPDAHLDRAVYWGNLGKRLVSRYKLRGSRADLEEAKSCFLEGLFSQQCSISKRVRCTSLFFSTPDILDDKDRTAAVSKAMIELLPLLASASLQSAEKQKLLSEAAAFACDAAATAIHHGSSPFEVLQILEAGRSVLATSLQDLRSDISDLESADPDLATTFNELRMRLDGPDREPNATSRQFTADVRHQTSAEMSRVLAAIRQRPGFEDFLLPLTEARMQAVASDGPIVTVNISQYRCDAIIVERTGIRLLPLTGLSMTALADLHGKRQQVSTLSWLWTILVEPVLMSLNLPSPPANGVLPRIWWIPTGLLTRYPLHAAEHHLARNAATSLDRFISSYGISIKSLVHIRQQSLKVSQQQPESMKLALVSMPDTPGPRNDHLLLPFASIEASAVKKACFIHGLECPKVSATKSDVLAALEKCSLFHFAGHGDTHVDPLQSRLLLEDWQSESLSVQSLLDVNLSANAPFLAFLSACGTGRIRKAASLDEGVHLTSAFQLAGFRHVVGTLWSVSDQLCKDMAGHFYEFLFTSPFNGMNDERVSRALHYATKKLRDDWAAGFPVVRVSSTRDAEKANVNMTLESLEPLWIPYVHFGC